MMNDKKYMARALELAQLGGVSAAPNPMVGSVIVWNDKIIGEGYHQKAGEAHAEVNAVNSVSDKDLLKESTIYVTLEPCSHYGKTPPCADLIVQHQFKRVVIACLDTNAKVSGKGIERIRNAGIHVDIGVLEKEARHLNRRFFTFLEKKRPYIILKWAETRDGFMDRLPEDRASGINWITEPKTKLYVHHWRAQEQAIMVGWGTINNDNPQLNVREVAGTSPHRFIIDPKGKTLANSKVYTDGQPTTVISAVKKNEQLPHHVEWIMLEEINSEQILSVLYEKKILSVFIEGGAETHTRFIDSNLWDECYQLIGATSFQKGISAPNLKNQILVDEKIRGNDIIRHYLNKSI